LSVRFGLRITAKYENWQRRRKKVSTPGTWTHGNTWLWSSDWIKMKALKKRIKNGEEVKKKMKNRRKQFEWSEDTKEINSKDWITITKLRTGWLHNGRTSKHGMFFWQCQTKSHPYTMRQRKKIGIDEKWRYKKKYKQKEKKLKKEKLIECVKKIGFYQGFWINVNKTEVDKKDKLKDLKKRKLRLWRPKMVKKG
jgi:hypothetical protein